MIFKHVYNFDRFLDHLEVGYNSFIFDAIWIQNQRFGTK